MVTEALSLEEVLEPILRQQKENHPSVQCELQVPPGLRARASRDGLREVLSCLLENAFQATAYAEGLASPRVTVRAERIGDTLRIDILDNGPGVAAKDRERIFEPYVTTKKGGEGNKPMGTGMGLAIARRYAQHMGGAEPGQAHEDVEHGLSTLSRLLDAEPFRPIVVVTAHSRDRELMRRVFQRTHGGQFVFKDSEDLERELLKAVDVALASPAFRMSRTVAEFKQLLEQKQDEDVYRKFIHKHWEVFLGPEYREVQSPYPITRGGNIDLLAIRHDGFPDLWELKRPDDPVFKEYNQWLHHSLECSRAIGQLMEYYDAAQREPRPGLRHYDARRGVDMELHRPRGFVVIGRTRNAEERERLRLENSFLAGITLLTYDDLVERAEHLLTFLQRYRNGDSPET